MVVSYINKMCLEGAIDPRFLYVLDLEAWRRTTSESLRWTIF